jgi:cyanophycinase
MNHLLLVAAILGKGPEIPVSHLVIVGGGPTTQEIAAKTLFLAGGSKARVLIIPQASSRMEVGLLSEEMWRKVGAHHVTILDLKNDKSAQTAIKQADLIWMSGGNQERLMQALTRHGIVQAIRERFRRGGVTVGGTSAGAAVMSKIMLTGDAQVDQLSTDLKTAEGLGLWPEVIIDQHYVRRPARYNRLLSAVLCHPDEVGIGIDECTAIVVEGRKFEVIGKSNVIVIDARKGKIQSKKGEAAAAGNLSLHVLRAGSRFDLSAGLLAR